MSASAWVELSLLKLNCSQKDLAEKLEVSPSQITKWKANEHISLEMEKKFRHLTGIHSHNPEFVLWTHSDENADKWARLIAELAEFALEEAETGYNTLPLQEEPELLCWKTVHTLSEMGISLPQNFPSELEHIVDEEYDDEDFDLALSNAYAATIFSIFKSLNDVFGFYAAYVAELHEGDDAEDLWDTGMEVESCLMDLAASKISVATDFAPKFPKFRYEVRRDYKGWLEKIQKSALASGKPLRADILDMVDQDHDALGHEAEAESLGSNSGRIHPDIYMNELLEGMRAIHQVLPAIIQKLGITEEELNFDPSKLRRG